MMRKIVIASIILWVNICVAGQVFIKNSSYQGGVKVTIQQQIYEIRNIRIRVVSRLLFNKSNNFIRNYLNKYQMLVQKAFVPNFLLTESAAVDIYGHIAPSDKFTLIVSADGYVGNIRAKKFLIYSEDMILDTPLDCEDVMMLTVGSLKKDGAHLVIDFNALINRNDGRGFVQSGKKHTHYFSLLD